MKSYEAAMNKITIEQETMQLNARNLTVYISGGVVGRMKMSAVLSGIVGLDSLKSAIQKCANEYCILCAVKAALANS